MSLNTTSDSELQARTSLNMVQEVKSVSVLGLDSCCPTSETSLHGAGELDSHGARAGHAVKSNLVLRMGHVTGVATRVPLWTSKMMGCDLKL